MTKSLILGANGLVGTSIAKQLPFATRKSHSECDITKYEQLLEVFENIRPQVVYLPASITSVDKCENIETNTTNVNGALNVLHLCESFEAKLVYFSSSYVFSGKSSYPYSTTQRTNPIQNYGIQKDALEKAIISSDANNLIIRTVGVFGKHNKNLNFPTQVLKSVMSGKQIFVPIDQYMNPIFVDDLTRNTVRLINERYDGIWHIAGDTCMTKYEFAQQVALSYGYEDLIIPISSDEMNQKAERPKMGCLDCSTLEEIGLSMPSFERGLRIFLESYE